MQAVASSTPRQRRKQARPQELLEAALSLFVEKGFAATKIEEVAQRAGVSKGTLYLYFESKEELLKAVIQDTLAAEIAAGAQEIERFEGSVSDLVSNVLGAWWSRVYDSPASGVFKLLITEMRNFPDMSAFYAREVIQPGQALIAGLIERGIAGGEFRRVNVQSAVQSVILPMVMLCLHKHSISACMAAESLQQDPKVFIHDHLRLLVEGLRAAPPKIRR